RRLCVPWPFSSAKVSNIVMPFQFYDEVFPELLLLCVVRGIILLLKDFHLVKQSPERFESIILRDATLRSAR
ncbi:hypothetical protein, partial [Serratia marcescens]|uniref:hypothetical protein n=1 Tax=Serratia marcescens TaxID=615 RepID=UPI00195487BB